MCRPPDWSPPDRPPSSSPGQLTPGVNLGLIAFSGSPTVLVSPSPQHYLTVDALDKLRTDESTATGQAIFAALQAIQTVNTVLQGPGTRRLRHG